MINPNIHSNRSNTVCIQESESAKPIVITLKSGERIYPNEKQAAEHKPYAQCYWEKVSGALDVTSKVLDELKNTKTPHLINFGSRFAEGFGFATTGLINAGSNGFILPSAIPGWAQLAYGTYHLAMAAYVSKGVYDSAMASDTLKNSLGEIEKGLTMMRQLNDANSTNNKEIEIHLLSVASSLKNEQEALNTLKLDLQKQAHSINYEMQTQKKALEANIELLDVTQNELTQALEANQSAIKIIERGTMELLFANETFVEGTIDPEVVKKLLNTLKTATTDFVEGILLSTESSQKMHEGIKKISCMNEKLQNNFNRLLREFKHGQDKCLEMADRVEILENDNISNQVEIKDAYCLNRKMQKRFEKQNIIHIKTTESVEKAKERANLNANSWHITDHLTGVAAAIGGGAFGFFTGGPFAMMSGAYAGYQLAGKSAHELGQKKEAYKKELAQKVQVDDPQDGKSISIKFAPSSTWCNWIPKTTTWKDSATIGCFKVMIGDKVFQGAYDKNVHGKGSLDFDDQMELINALTDALTEGKITGNECSSIIELLSKPMLVPCERTEGNVETIPIQLIDKEEPVFVELSKAIDKLCISNLENSLLITTLNLEKK